MDHFSGDESNFDDDSQTDSPSTYEPADDGYNAEGGFDIGIADGDAVDIDGDGIADGTAQVSYSDLDEDGVADHAEVVVDADTDGDGEVDTVVILNQYDTDGDGFADEVDMTYGVDTDGDGLIDSSDYSTGEITNTPVDTDGDGTADTMTASVTWDDTTHASANEGSDSEASDETELITANVNGQSYEFTPTHDVDGDGAADTAVVETSDGNFVVVTDIDEDGVADAAVLTDAQGSVIESAYVDPATGEWVEGSAAATDY